MTFIHPEQCTDCARCVPACQEHAIFHEDTVPDEWQEYTWVNYHACATRGGEDVSAEQRLTRCRRPPSAPA